MAAKKEKPEVLSFEDRLAKVEALIARMESGAAPLEETLKDYEEGIRCLNAMEKDLQAARQRLSILREQPDGTLREEPLEEEA